MLQIGNYNELIVEKEVPFGIYLNSDQGEILMPKKYVPEGVKPGDSLNAFIYRDSEDRLLATTLKPKAVVGEFAALKAKEVNDKGAFLDWGLEKDLLVPHAEQHKKMEPGLTYVVKVLLDPKSHRIIGVSKIGPFLAKDHDGLSLDQEVALMVYEITDLGYMCIINERYRGMLYRNEVYKALQVGDKITGYIKRLREDGKIDLSLQRFGYKKITDVRDIILNKLEENNGELLFSDKSSPEDIEKEFQMSKKNFKKVIGALYKEGKILLEEYSIRLNSKK